MISKVWFLCLIVFSFSNYGNAQEVVPIGIYGGLSTIGTSSWASGGTGVAERGLSSAIVYNPACINYQSMSVTMEMNGKMPMSLPKHDFYYDGLVSIPSLITVGFSKDNWNFVAGYFNYYDHSAHVHHKIIKSPNWYWVRTTNELSSDITIQSFSASANYNERNMTYGITIGLNMLRDDESELLKLTSAGNGLGIFISSGILLKVSDKLDFGSSIRYSSSINYAIDSVNHKTDYSARFPFIIESGISSLINPRVRILASVECQNYSNIYDTHDYFFQVHTGSIVYLSKNINLRAGYFTRIIPALFNQCFLSFGIDVKTHPMDLSLSVLDTHAFPLPNDYHQTIISLGGTYKFD